MAKVLSNFPKAHAGEDSGEYYNSGSSPSGHSVKRTALHARTAAFTKPRFLIWQHTNSVFLHSRKRLLPLTDAPRVFSYDSFHCIFTDQLNTFSKAGSSTSRTHASLTIIEWRWVSCEESCRHADRSRSCFYPPSRNPLQFHLRIALNSFAISLSFAPTVIPETANLPRRYLAWRQWRIICIRSLTCSWMRSVIVQSEHVPIWTVLAG